eukprot:CAMPEP_0194350366 /NCGR_PEP_ID=MMETSP0171-20130528/107600_1 /TAXON_ID=218684 /ORGANISM="Corethron pennatum, Strain L29A3" /LENGTH=157 /DNA_ID=CAMNT_0039117909 /DNA_START=399 /DNA_END=875 /DNA_ORIENTATION=+
MSALGFNPTKIRDLGARCRWSCGTCAAVNVAAVQTTDLMATTPPKDVTASACRDNREFVDEQGRRCVYYVDALCDGLRSAGYTELEVLRIALRAGAGDHANMIASTREPFCRALLLRNGRFRLSCDGYSAQQIAELLVRCPVSCDACLSGAPPSEAP